MKRQKWTDLWVEKKRPHSHHSFLFVLWSLIRQAIKLNLIFTIVFIMKTFIIRFNCHTKQTENIEYYCSLFSGIGSLIDRNDVCGPGPRGRACNIVISILIGENWIWNKPIIKAITHLIELKDEEAGFVNYWFRKGRLFLFCWFSLHRAQQKTFLIKEMKSCPICEARQSTHTNPICNQMYSFVNYYLYGCDELRVNKNKSPQLRAGARTLQRKWSYKIYTAFIDYDLKCCNDPSKSDEWPIRG